MGKKTKTIDKQELRDAINEAARALEAYWDAERAVELLVAGDAESEDSSIDDLKEWIEPYAVSGGEISDEDLDLFIATEIEGEEAKTK